MCGIAGKISYSDPITEQELQRYGTFLKERGPENLGLWIKDNIGFVHTRLSIVDLHEVANQPMHIKDQFTITFNGEIYNHKSLKKELELYTSFESHSDTEVILRGCQVWGVTKTLEKLDGMFAFALLDHKDRTVYLARDRFGKKPLYYYKGTNRFIFSSDIRVIHTSEKSSLSLNFDSIDYYLTELSSPQPATIWNEIKQIKPGHYLKYTIDDPQLSEQSYWDGIDPKTKLDIDLSEAVQLTEKSLMQAIDKRLGADVPMACFLSGGVDSGLIVSMLASKSKERVKTFSFGLSSGEMNELPEARIVANKYNTDHREIILEVDAMKILPKIIPYMGEPFADSSIIPSYYVTRSISEHVKVAISGDGGDELFGGYNDYGIAFRADQFLASYQNQTIKKAAILWDKVYGRIVNKKENLGSLNHYSQISGAQRMYRQMGYSFSDIQKVYSENFSDKSKGYTESFLNQVWDRQAGEDLTDKLLVGSLQTRLLNDYLVKIDRSSMFNSLEVRSPFLDVDLANLAFSIPNQHKFHSDSNKYILKKLAEKYFDANIWTRSKRGFGIPIGDWMANEMFDYMKETILDGYFVENKIFSKQFLEEEIKQHRSGNYKTHKLWAILCLEIWASEFL